jgi:hypothetical protein
MLTKAVILRCELKVLPDYFVSFFIFMHRKRMSILSSRHIPTYGDASAKYQHLGIDRRPDSPYLCPQQAIK